MEHGEIVDGALLVARGNPPELLQAVEQALDTVARPIRRAVKAGPAALVGLARDHRADAAPAQMRPCRLARKSLVARHPPGPQARAPAALATDSPRVKQGGKRDAVVALAARQMEGDGLAVSLGADVDLGREAPARAAERLTVLPPLAPAAETWARTTVESNI